jgi:hypothetical protein
MVESLSLAMPGSSSPVVPIDADALSEKSYGSAFFSEATSPSWSKSSTLAAFTLRTPANLSWNSARPSAA